jgi:hypothetical protein
MAANDKTPHVGDSEVPPAGGRVHSQQSEAELPPSAPTTTPGAGVPSPEPSAPGPTLPTTAQVLRDLAEGVDFGNQVGLREHLLNAALACDGFPLACRQLDEARERIAALKRAARGFLRVALDSGASWQELEAAAEFRAVLDAEDGGV